VQAAVPSSAIVVTTWPGFLTTLAALFLANATLTFFLARAVFDRLVVRSLESDDQKPLVDRLVVDSLARRAAELRRMIDGLYDREIRENAGARATAVENAQRLAWIDGQVKAQAEQIRQQVAAHNEQMAMALEKLSESMDRSNDRLDKSNERTDLAIGALTRETSALGKTLADLQGFLRAKPWDGNERRGQGGDD
jgi:hypothetical protein